MDNTEKLTLIAELNTLRAKVMAEDKIAGLEKVSRDEYDSLIVEIDEKYNEKFDDASTAHDAAIDAANRAFETAKKAYTAATEKAETAFAATKESLDAARAKMEEDAVAYYKGLQESDARTIAMQKELADTIAEKQARLEEIIAEEDRIRQEEEKRLAEEEKARQEAAAKVAPTPAAPGRPRIRF